MGSCVMNFQLCVCVCACVRVRVCACAIQSDFNIHPLAPPWRCKRVGLQLSAHSEWAAVLPHLPWPVSQVGQLKGCCFFFI